MEQAHPFLLYTIAARKDALWRERLETHLAVFAKTYSIQFWSSQKMLPGEHIQEEQKNKLREASLVLLLVSADCFQECDAEITFLDEHCPFTTVLPVLVHTFNLRYTPFSGLMPLPSNGTPLDLWTNRDKGLQEVTSRICERILQQLVPETPSGGQKLQKLRAMLADHSAFLNDRLESFVGRQQELSEIQALIAEKQQAGGYITITGQAGQGKSSIIAKLVEIYGRENVAYHFIPFNPGLDHQVGLLRNLMARLILKHHLSDLYVATESRPALKDYFFNMLKELSAKGVQEILFLDGLDQIEEDFNGVRDLSFLPDQPPQGIVFVLGTRPNDSLRPLALLHPYIEYRLSDFSRKDFDLILHHRAIGLTPALADQLYLAMQENALYLDLAAKELHEQRTLAPETLIGRLANDPNNLFSLSFERLKRPSLEWREVLKPLLGYLLAAQEPLSHGHLRQLLPTIDDERLREGLVRLGGLLITTKQRTYALFHLKLREYLHEDEENPEKPHIFAQDEEEHYHELLAKWCEGGGLQHIWEETRDPKEQARRLYARRYYVTHLYQAHLDQPLFAVLDEGSYGQAKERWDRATRSYLQDLDLGRRAVMRVQMDDEKAIASLPILWRYTLLRCSLGSQADQYPDELFAGLLLVHREADVLGMAEILTDKVAKVRLLLHIGRHFAFQVNKSPESIQALLRAQSVAASIEDMERKAETSYELAVALAQTGQWEWAEKVATSIENTSSRVVALGTISRTLAQAGQWEWAEKVATSIENASARATALNTTAQVLAQMGQKEQVSRILAQAEKVATAIENASAKVTALGTIAQALAQIGQEEQASRILAQAEKVTASITDERVRRQTGEEVRRQAFNFLARILVQAGLGERAEEITASIEDTTRKAEALSEIAQALAQAGQWEQAEEVIVSITNTYIKVAALCKLAETLAQARQDRQVRRVQAQAEEVITFIEDTKRKAKALRDLSVSLAQTGQWEQAEEIAASIKETFDRAWAFSRLAIALVRAEQWEQAEKVATSVEDTSIRGNVLEELVVGLAQSGQWEQAKTIIASQQGITSDLHSEMLTWKLARARQWEQAEEFITSIKSIFDKAKALRILARELIQAEQWERAKEIAASIEYGNITKDASEREKSIMGEDFKSSITTYNVDALDELAQKLAQVSQWEQAKEIVASITDRDKRIKASGKLAQALALAGQEEQASRLLTQAEKELTNSPEEVDHEAWVLGELAQVLTQARQWEQVKEIASLVGNRELKVKILHELATALIQVSQWEKAEEIVSLVEETELKTTILHELAIALIQASQWKKAEETTALVIEIRAKILYGLDMAFIQANQSEKFKEITTLIENENLQVEALGELAVALALAGQIEQALEIVVSVEDEDNRVTILYKLALALAQTEQKEQVGRILVQMREVVTSTEDMSTQVEALRSIALIFAQIGQEEQMRRVLAQAKEVIASIENGKQRARALCELALALAQAQQWEQAEEVMDLIELVDEWTWALKGLARVLTQAQQWDRAEKVIASIEDTNDKSWALYDLAKALAQAEEWDRAEKIIAFIPMEYRFLQEMVLDEQAKALAQAGQWERAKEIINTTKYKSQKDEVLGEQAKALAQAGQWERAKEIINTIEHTSNQDSALSELAKALAQAEQWEQIEEVAASIESTDSKDGVLGILVTALAQAGLTERAEEVAASVTSVNQKAEALRTIAEALAHAGREKQLLSLLQRTWISVETRFDAWSLLLIASPFLTKDTFLSSEFLASLRWVNSFLKTI